MVKVLIVDDEVLVRVGIRSTIDWDSNGLSVILDVSNGKEALKVCEREKPDIILTDIKMPSMDGITLMEKVREMGLSTEFIVLTSYKEYDYAKRALKLGAYDFIEKSLMSPDELLETMVRLKDKILVSKNNEEVKKSNENFTEVKIESDEEKLAKYIINKSFDREDLEGLLSVNGFNVASTYYTVLLFYVSDLEENYCSNNENRIKRQSIINISNETVSSRYGGNVIWISESIFLYIVFISQDKGSITQYSESIAMRVQKAINWYLQINVAVTISDTSMNLKEIPEIIEQLQAMRKYNLFLGDNSIVTRKFIENYVDEENFDDYLLNKDLSKLIFSIEQGLTEDVGYLLEHMLSSKYKNKFSLIFFNYSYNSILLNINKLALGSQFKEEVVELSNMIARGVIESNSEYKKSIEKLKNICISIGQKKMKQKYYSGDNGTIIDAIKYIQNNYYKDISLNSIASEVNMSRTYFSKLFKQETKENFVDFLNKIRIEKAKEIMYSKNLKNYELSELVGYKDSSYFSKIFKKIEGKTPTDYYLEISKKI